MESYELTEEIEDDKILFEDKMEALKTQLQAQFANWNELQNRILESFEKL